MLILLLPNQLANASNQWLDVAWKIRINLNEQHETTKEQKFKTRRENKKFKIQTINNKPTK